MIYRSERQDAAIQQLSEAALFCEWSSTFLHQISKYREASDRSQNMG